MAIEVDGETLRNLQEQVTYLTDQLRIIKQSLGEALPSPIAGPKGDKGDNGNKGDKGDTGSIIIGVRTTPPPAREDDYYIEQTSDMNGVNYYLNRKSAGKWYRLFSMKGNQGIKGDDGSVVVANPPEEATENISKIDIDGVVYNVIADDEFITSLKETISIDDSKNVEFGHDVEIDGELQVNSDVTIDGELKIPQMCISGGGYTIYLSNIGSKVYRHKLKLITSNREVNVELFSTDFEELREIYLDRNLVCLFGYWDNGANSKPIYKIWFERIGDDTHVHFADGDLYYDEIINSVVDTVTQL